MRQNSEFRRAAREKLEGNWGTAVLVTLVYFVIFGAIGGGSQTPRTSFINIASLLLTPLAYGFYILFLDLVRGTKLDINRLFDGFKDYWRILGTMLLETLYILLWTLLLIIPGIIKVYSYSMTCYILKDEPELKLNGAIEKSMAMMEGHKLDLFLLHLSFIGWFILSCITLGIGFLFLEPYVLTAQSEFYEDLKSEYEVVPQPRMTKPYIE